MNQQHYGPEASQLEETPREKEWRIRDEILTKVQTDMPTYQLYHKNNLFRQVVDAVARGKDAWEVILLLIEMDEKNRAMIRKLLEQWPLQNPPVL